MMYKEKLLASIKANGKILREFKDTVYIPFGIEWSLLLKNLNTVRAVVNVFIDGENAVPGGLVIDPGHSIDLERWIKNGNLSEGNRFKFVERTSAIENGPRGIKEEDGLIRVEYQFEMPIVNAIWNQYPPSVQTSDQYWTNDTYTAISTSYNLNGILRSRSLTAQATSAAVNCAQSNIGVGELQATAATKGWNDVGITVPGSKSEQKFQTTTVGALDPTKHNIVLRIVGDLGHNKPVEQAITVNHKPECVTCGKKNKATAKFCNQCGTSLEIFA